MTGYCVRECVRAHGYLKDDIIPLSHLKTKINLYYI